MTDLTSWNPQNVPPGMDGTYEGHDCCEYHTLRCEPPSELCCGECAEVEHPAHVAGTMCVLTVAALWAEHVRQGAALVGPQQLVDSLRGMLADVERRDAGHHGA